MPESGLQGRQKRRYWECTTDSLHDESIAPSWLASAPEPTKPDEVWGSDITSGGCVTKPRRILATRTERC